ncbi:uncharacterized protein LOC134535643 [Bacillus rossius redtenbacheri]|uniref:uncharacterized protein LOC134535643 n=1 Tax=Bacillus rossius redtenbacheri TaxID=93214 RepID=UPI002FDD7355
MLSSPASLETRTLCMFLTLLAGVSGASLGMIDRSGPRAHDRAVVHASPSAAAGPEYVRLPAGPSRGHRTWLVPGGGSRVWQHDFGPGSPAGEVLQQLQPARAVDTRPSSSSPPAQAEDSPLVVSSGSWTNTASLGDSAPAAPSGVPDASADPGGARGAGKASFYVDPGDSSSGNAGNSSGSTTTTTTTTTTASSSDGSSDDDDDDDGE